MAEIKKFPGSSFTVFIGAKRTNLDGTESPLDMTGKVAWVRQILSGGQISLARIAGSSVVVAPAAEVTALNYAGDKTKATWLKLFLPAGDFSTLSAATISVYVGSAEDANDAEAAVAPFVIRRITTGSEGIVP